MNPIKAVKTHIHTNPNPYIITAAVVGVTVGAALATKFGVRSMLDEVATINKFQETMKEAGKLVVIVPIDTLNPITETLTEIVL